MLSPVACTKLRLLILTCRLSETVSSTMCSVDTILIGRPISTVGSAFVPWSFCQPTGRMIASIALAILAPLARSRDGRELPLALHRAVFEREDPRHAFLRVGQSTNGQVALPPVAPRPVDHVQLVRADRKHLVALHVRMEVDREPRDRGHDLFYLGAADFLPHRGADAVLVEAVELVLEEAVHPHVGRDVGLSHGVETITQRGVDVRLCERRRGE